MDRGAWEGMLVVIVVIKSLARKPWRNRRTYRLIETSLQRRWKNVRSVLAANEEELHARLSAEGTPRGTFVFNVAEYLDEKRKRGFIPGLLDSWGFPHLGSSAATVLTGLDKGLTKEILVRKGVPTPPFFVSEPRDLEMRERGARIGYPLLVKPLREGGRAGIRKDSVVYGPESLEKAVLRVSLTYRQPALVEQYVEGGDMREFTVGVIGSRRRVHLPIEIDWERMNVSPRVLSCESARKDLERVKLVEDGSTTWALADLADRAFDAVGAFDFARVDIRARGKQLLVLEINIMPGLGAHGFLSLAAKDLFGFDHDELICMIARESIKRQGLDRTA
jgi:D-alanine-D-alanine ligase